MSYSQNRTTESWNNDPNHFAKSGRPNFGYERGTDAEGGVRQQQWDGFENQPNQSAGIRPTHDPTDTSTWGTSSVQQPQPLSGWERTEVGRRGGDLGGHQPGVQGDKGLWAAGPGEDYGSTGTGAADYGTDVNTFGAGGDHFDRAGPDQGGFREGDHVGRDGKPSIGQKIKGNVEKITDRVTGRQV